MKLAVVRERRICFDNNVRMRNLCMHNAKKLENVWVQLLCCPLLLRILFPREPPSPIMILWFLLFTANIQNKRENLGMMMTTMVLFTFLNPLLLRILAGPNLVPEGDESIQAPEGAAVPPAPNIG
jgi:hypothetical protein